ncbi:hypothetical protein Y032_0001g198 [Ancylostoma ceylanicum]|nr:hypothetical protein Y032_0001g198 [Ancylostoma ceylanicum]
MASSAILALLVLAFAASSNGQKAFKCSNPGLSDDLRQVFLSFHNDARRRVAKGTEPNKVGKLNPAKNMYKLEWDCAMEKQAQDSIATCSGDFGPFENMGQNINRFSSFRGFSDPRAQINSTLNSWWGVAKKYGVTDKENKYVGHLYTFANMVFAETTKLGCAYKICGKAMSITCLYNAIGYYDDTPMWETGKACTKGTDCTTHPNSACDAGLCVRGADIPDTNNICPANSGMPDAARKMFLDMHNKFRSSVARGLEVDGLGGKAPKAAKMLKMVYDCTVEASAIRYSKKCLFKHSAKTERKGLNENLYKSGGIKFDKVKAAAQASQLWWDELKEFGVGQANILTPQLWTRPKKPIGHYTQMAWEKSYKLGCAVEHCPSFTLGVCHYGPGGNIIGQPIYTVGKPCTRDSDCPGSYTCSVAEGLCNVV